MSSGTDPATVLVVEDDAVLGQVLGRILSQDGHVVRQAENADAALEELKDCTPRLVLLDAGLRNGSGMKLAEELRTRVAGIPIILLTASSASESDFPGWDAGRLLSKSINLPDLRRTVAAALASPEPSSSATPERLEAAHTTPAAPQAPPRQESVKETLMRLFESKLFKPVVVVAAAVLVLVALAAAKGAIPFPGSSDPEAGAPAADPPAISAVQLVPNKP